MAPDVAGNPMPGDAADPGADFLNRGHQRPGEQYYPSHAVAELRAGLRIGRNAARIVVRGAGDQSRAENSEQPPLRAAGPMARDACGKRPHMRFARVPGRPRLLFGQHQVIPSPAAAGLDECDNPALLL
jgi:hypothetical protein